MPSKKFNLPEIGEITVVKRRGNRHIRLSFDASGNVRISLPPHAPYHTGLAFAKSKRAWIIKHRPLAPEALVSGQIIANNYLLVFNASASAKRASATVKASKIVVTHPSALAIASAEAQKAANRGIKKALKLEAEKVLPNRLAELAKIHGYSYNSVKIKPLKRRWGSCDNNANITLNLYLVQLAPELIDYVLIHELVHTKNPHHQASFWQAMDSHLPDVNQLKKRARSAQPGQLA